MTTKIWTLIGIILLISAAGASPLRPHQASANGGTHLIVNDVKEGPYLFRVGILPGSPKVGNLHISVLIQSADGDDTINDGQITVMATAPEAGLTAGPVQAIKDPQNPQVFEANLYLSALGTWTMTLATVSELGEATLVVPLQVTKAGGFNLLIVVVVVGLAMAIAALVWSQIQQRKRRT